MTDRVSGICRNFETPGGCLLSIRFDLSVALFCLNSLSSPRFSLFSLEPSGRSDAHIEVIEDASAWNAKVRGSDA